MITKKDAVNQVLATIPVGQKITLDAAVTQANAIKALKNKNLKGTWKFHFGLHGVVTTDETGVYVSAKAVATPEPAKTE